MSSEQLRERIVSTSDSQLLSFRVHYITTFGIVKLGGSNVNP